MLSSLELQSKHLYHHTLIGKVQIYKDQNVNGEKLEMLASNSQFFFVELMLDANVANMSWLRVLTSEHMGYVCVMSTARIFEELTQIPNGE